MLSVPRHVRIVDKFCGWRDDRDVVPFVQVVLNPQTQSNQNPTCDPNRDGSVDILDVAGFVSLLLQ